jgi:hypothetical protein
VSLSLLATQTKSADGDTVSRVELEKEKERLARRLQRSTAVEMEAVKVNYRAKKEKLKGMVRQLSTQLSSTKAELGVGHKVACGTTQQRRHRVAPTLHRCRCCAGVGGRGDAAA